MSTTIWRFCLHDVVCDQGTHVGTELDVVWDNWVQGLGVSLWERGRVRPWITYEATDVCYLSSVRMETCLIWHGMMSCPTSWSVVVCDHGYPSRTWRQWLHGTSVQWSLVGLDVVSCPVLNTWRFLKFEFGRRSPYVLSMWAQVLLGGNHSWCHGASSEAAWVIDTWQVWSRRVYVPSSFHGKLTLRWFLQVGFQSLSRGFLRFLLIFKVKISQILYFLIVLSCGIVFQGS